MFAVAMPLGIFSYVLRCNVVLVVKLRMTKTDGGDHCDLKPGCSCQGEEGRKKQV